MKQLVGILAILVVGSVIGYGIYKIGFPRDTKSHGPYVLSMIPDDGNEMFGRSGFLMHGDSKSKPGTASKGCIIVGLTIREKVWLSGDTKLEVI